MSDMKQWQCKHGHILGYVRRNGDGVSQLMLLRNALDMGMEYPSEVDLLGPLSGSMPVRCSICDTVKPWAISVDGLVDLFERMDTQKVFQFSQRLLQRSKVSDVYKEK